MARETNLNAQENSITANPLTILRQIHSHSLNNQTLLALIHQRKATLTINQCMGTSRLLQTWGHLHDNSNNTKSNGMIPFLTRRFRLSMVTSWKKTTGTTVASTTIHRTWTIVLTWPTIMTLGWFLPIDHPPYKCQIRIHRRMIWWTVKKAISGKIRVQWRPISTIMKVAKHLMKTQVYHPKRLSNHSHMSKVCNKTWLPTNIRSLDIIIQLWALSIISSNKIREAWGQAEL